MNRVILGIDVGTTNVLAMLLNESGGVIGKALKGLQLNYPAPGHVEQDPEAMWMAVLDTVKQVLTSTRISSNHIAALGITGQRSTIVIWDRRTGRPLGPAIIWQDLRGSCRAAELNQMGFNTVNPLAAASKLELALSAIPDGHRRMKDGELGFWERAEVTNRLSDNIVGRDNSVESLKFCIFGGI